jgi:hypothetical protein
MEELLNKLINKGWIPFWMGCIEVKLNYEWITRAEFSDWLCYFRRSLRELVSKESGLWQFVCKNEMVKKWWWFWELWYSCWEIDLESRVRRQDYEYRLIESALCNEDKLEKFLLYNIKVDE